MCVLVWINIYMYIHTIYTSLTLSSFLFSHFTLLCASIPFIDPGSLWLSLRQAPSYRLRLHPKMHPWWYSCGEAGLVCSRYICSPPPRPTSIPFHALFSPCLNLFPSLPCSVRRARHTSISSLAFEHVQQFISRAERYRFRALCCAKSFRRAVYHALPLRACSRA